VGVLNAYGKVASAFSKLLSALFEWIELAYVATARPSAVLKIGWVRLKIG
jgi:hypothetical protein